MSIFSALFEKSFPLISCKLKIGSKPYINDEIKTLIKDKNKMLKKYSKHPIKYKNEWKLIRNKLTDRIRAAKHRYFKDQIDKFSGNAKDTWKVLNKLMGRSKSCTSVKELKTDSGHIVSDDVSISSEFNNFFISIGEVLSANLPISDVNPMQFMGEARGTTMELHGVMENEVVAGLGDVAAGCDQIPSKLIKKVVDVIKVPLTHICNLTFNTGIFPIDLKISKIIPLYKQGTKSNTSNYRPISLLPVFSKVIERLIYNQLDNYFNEHDFISPNQHGFRKSKSTLSAVLSLTDHVLNFFENNQFTIGIFLDFSKVFDLRL